MIRKHPLWVVIDTNVVFEGLTKQGGIASAIIDVWLNGMIQPCVTNALAYEYADVLSRKLSRSRWMELQPALGSLLRMVRMQWLLRPTFEIFVWRENRWDCKLYRR